MARRATKEDIGTIIIRALNKLCAGKSYESELNKLHRTGTEDVFSKAKKLVTSSDSNRRLLGVQILGLLGLPSKTFVSRAAEILVSMLSNENNPQVLSAIGWGLNHLGVGYNLEQIIKFKNSESPEVRLGVVAGLLGKAEEGAIETLIELSEDSDAEVRNWATFGLGNQIAIDTPQIRNALHRRLSDIDLETKIEAIHSLAARKDDRAVEHLLLRLVPEEVTYFDLEAAKTLAAAALLPALLKLKSCGTEEQEILDEAIHCCTPR